jgi:hypothetical protein
MAETHKVTLTFERLKAGCRLTLHAQTPAGRASFWGESDSPVGAIEEALKHTKRTPRNYALGGKSAGRNTTSYNVAGALKSAWKSK